MLPRLRWLTRVPILVLGAALTIPAGQTPAQASNDLAFTVQNYSGSDRCEVRGSSVLTPFLWKELVYRGTGMTIEPIHNDPKEPHDQKYVAFEVRGACVAYRDVKVYAQTTGFTDAVSTLKVDGKTVLANIGEGESARVNVNGVNLFVEYLDTYATESFRLFLDPNSQSASRLIWAGGNGRNQCLDVRGGRLEVGQRVGLWDCNDSQAQMITDSHGRIRFGKMDKGPHDWLCLENNDWSPAYLERCKDGYNQSWSVDGGWIHKGHGQCLAPIAEGSGRYWVHTESCDTNNHLRLERYLGAQ